MKNLLHITLCLLLGVVLSFQSFVKTALIINYQINKKEIAEKYCENKDKPMMCCEGKCHLEKQLKKDENFPTAKVPMVMKLKEIVENVAQFYEFKFYLASTENLYLAFCNNYSYSFSNSLLRPPQLSV